MKKTILIVSLMTLATIFFSEKAKIVGSEKIIEEHTIYSVLFHSPGSKWIDSLSFREQPGIEQHVNYMATLLENNKLILGGPFLDNSSGMVIFDGSVEEAEKAASDDPTVKSGLLNVKVKPWMVVMSTKEVN